MANMLTIVEDGPLFKNRRIRYNVALSGLYVQAVRGSNVGEVLNLGAAVGKFDAMQYWGYTGPKFGDPAQPPAGYTAKIVPGADGSHWLFQIYSSAGNELAAGAYPAAILAELDCFVEFWGADYK
jgi:hypothetical protein